MADWPNAVPCKGIDRQITTAIQIQRATPPDLRKPKPITPIEPSQLTGYESHSAAFLSDGQQQHLALAHAIVRETPVVLYAEPLSKLYTKLCAETCLELRKSSSDLDGGSQQAGEKATVTVRWVDVRMVQGDKDDTGALNGTVCEIVFLDETIGYKVATGSAHRVARLHSANLLLWVTI